MTTQSRMTLAAAIGTLAIGAAESHAIVIYDAGTPSDLPNPTLFARFDADGAGLIDGNASAVVVGPNQILTVRHSTGNAPAPNATFEIPLLSGPNQGVYKVKTGSTELNLGPNIDARVFTVSKLDDSPANFTVVAPVYTGSLNLSTTGLDVAIGGYGRQISTPLGSGDGYNVTASPNDNSYNLLQGYNHIFDADLDGIPSYTPWQDTPFIFADFDGPTGTELDGLTKRPFEATIAQYDSGGGWFVKNGANWELLGLGAIADTPGTADYGDLLGAVYLTPYASIVPEPAAMLPMAIAGLSLLRRRFRRR